MPGAAFTLDASGGHAACRQGVGTRQSRLACPRTASPARTDAGCNRRGCQSEARRDVWG